MTSIARTSFFLLLAIILVAPAARAVDPRVGELAKQVANRNARQATAQKRRWSEVKTTLRELGRNADLRTALRFLPEGSGRHEVVLGKKIEEDYFFARHPITTELVLKPSGLRVRTTMDSLRWPGTKAVSERPASYFGFLWLMPYGWSHLTSESINARVHSWLNDQLP